MEQAIERIFVGWERPFLERALPRWIEVARARGLEPADCILVLPGRRAVRRAEERLAELAPRDWPPPRVITAGGLARELCAAHLALASAWDRALAWREALRARPREERAALWGGGGADELPLRALAQACARTCDALAAEGVSAADVAARALRDATLGEPQRWRALAAAEQAYLAELERLGRIDPARAATHVARHGEMRAGIHVFLLALVDLPGAQRELLARLGSDVTSLVFAPEELAAGFDELGALRDAFWAERDIALPRERWLVVDTPAEQARAALEHLASLAPSTTPEDVSIGVPDDDVRPYLERSLLERGCEPRWAGGAPLGLTRPALLVTALLAWLEERRFEDFATLVRHPDLDLALARALGVEPGTLAADLDAYAAVHVPARIDGSWLADARTRANSERLARAHETLLALLGPLASGARRACGAWADALAELLARVWPELEPDARERDAWTHARACEALAEIVAEARASDPGVVLGAREALELFSERIAAAALPPPPPPAGRPVIELSGWLELVLDDAAHLVLTGVNEGALPSPSGSDPLLHEAARRALGLGHEARRVARDTWALSAILASRPGALLVSGRVSSRRDPRTPSRLLFRCTPEVALERVRRAWPERSAEPPLSRAPRYAYRPPLIAGPPPTRMSVTSFKTYLGSPYLFYLQHVLGLRSVDDSALELDPLGFGSLAHEVLQAFGGSALTVSTSEATIRELVCDELARIAAARFGARPRAAVRLQIERLRRRLESFAAWQARQPAAGWELAYAEHKVTGVALEGMELRGRIDRIDVNADGRRWRIVDYKTGDSVKTPRAVHGKPGAWKDLQLPLYRYIVEAIAPEDCELSVGYVTLGKLEREDLFDELPLDGTAYDDALKCGRDVVAKVRACEFEEVGDIQPSDEILAALCGFGLVEEEEDEEVPQ